jgi:hypothetical protein
VLPVNDWLYMLTTLDRLVEERALRWCLAWCKREEQCDIGSNKRVEIFVLMHSTSLDLEIVAYGLHTSCVTSRKVNFECRVFIGYRKSSANRWRSFRTAASSLTAREKSTERTSRRPSLLRDSFSCAKEAKPLTAFSGVRAVTVGLMLKLMYEPGVALGTLLRVRLTWSCKAVTVLKRFSPVFGLTPSNWAL